LIQFPSLAKQPVTFGEITSLGGQLQLFVEPFCEFANLSKIHWRAPCFEENAGDAKTFDEPDRSPPALVPGNRPAVQAISSQPQRTTLRGFTGDGRAAKDERISTWNARSPNKSQNNEIDAMINTPNSERTRFERIKPARPLPAVKHGACRG
jgi:hypothetical protein